MATTKQAIMTIGVSCSGKSTWAAEHIRATKSTNKEWRIVCRDDIRLDVWQMKHPTVPFSWDKWNWKWEKEVTTIQENLFNQYYADPFVDGVVVVDTNLNDKIRQQVQTKLQALGFEVSFKYFNVSFEEACKRDAARVNGVGYSIIAKQMESWNDQFGIKKYVADESLPKAILVDVDGTVALMKDRSPFDWDKVDQDLPHFPVIEVVRAMYAQGYKVVFLSGRSAVCFKKTQKWLEDNVGIFFSLYMRNEGDNRDDREVKKDLFDLFVASDYNVILSIDDRPKVCRLYRELGIPLLQVGNPYREF